MATIQFSSAAWYIGGNHAYSGVLGNDWNKNTNTVISRVGRFQFLAPSTGATHVDITLYSGGRGSGSHIPLKFFIGTSETGHEDAGPNSEATGTLTLGEDWLTFTGSADILLLPDKTYYLWVFPGGDEYGWYWGTRANYTSGLTTSGASMSLVSGTDGVLNSPHQLQLTRYSDSLTHKLLAVCGEESLTIADGVQEDIVTWTPPIDWAEQNTSGTTVSVTVTCITYQGETPIGETSVLLGFFIPESVAPSVLVSVDDKNNYARKYGGYVQSKSKARASATALESYGASITSCVITCGALTKSGTLVDFDLFNAGSVRVEATVTDSRGRKATSSMAIPVLPYNPPKATITAAYRCDSEGNEDPDGEYAAVVFNAEVTPLNRRNSASYAVAYRVRGTFSWSSMEVSSLSGNYAPSEVMQVIPISTQSGYDLSVEATDDFGPVQSPYRTIQVAFALADFDRANKAIGLGQKATVANTVAFGLPAMLNKGFVTPPLSVSSFDDIDDTLFGIVEKLPMYAFDFCVFVIGGSVWHCFVFKANSENATAEFYGYAGRRRKVLSNGSWTDLISIR